MRLPRILPSLLLLSSATHVWAQCSTVKSECDPSKGMEYNEKFCRPRLAKKKWCPNEKAYLCETKAVKGDGVFSYLWAMCDVNVCSTGPDGSSSSYSNPNSVYCDTYGLPFKREASCSPLSPEYSRLQSKYGNLKNTIMLALSPKAWTKFENNEVNEWKPETVKSTYHRWESDKSLRKKIETGVSQYLACLGIKGLAVKFVDYDPVIEAVAQSENSKDAFYNLNFYLVHFTSIGGALQGRSFSNIDANASGYKKQDHDIKVEFSRTIVPTVNGVSFINSGLNTEEKRINQTIMATTHEIMHALVDRTQDYAINREPKDYLKKPDKFLTFYKTPNECPDTTTPKGYTSFKEAYYKKINLENSHIEKTLLADGNGGFGEMSAKAAFNPNYNSATACKMFKPVGFDNNLTAITEVRNFVNARVQQMNSGSCYRPCALRVP